MRKVQTKTLVMVKMVKIMNPYVVSAEVNIFDGVLVGSIPFEPGLNILSGENGTCKTNLLRQIKAGRIKVSNDLPPNKIKIQAFSPKRNAERKSVEKILQEIRQQNRDFSVYINERIQAQLQDNTFDKYPSLGELYYYMYDDARKDGENQKEKMIDVTNQFNMIIKKIFQNYELVSEWDSNKGSPKIELRKNNTQKISLESLSCGEQEVLSLVLNLYTSREPHDVFLIDEPEIHLNWHLEEKLFTFLDWFCSMYDKQVIVATHSRIIFKRDFLRRTQFLFWDGDRISHDKHITEELINKIAGEAIDIIKLGDFEKTTFFVEDRNQNEVIVKISNILGKQVSVSECGNSTNVKSLFRLSRKDGGWRNSFFLIDGDNQKNPFPDQNQFIHLDKYCIENYLLNFKIAAKVAKKTENQVREAIFKSIIKNKDKIPKKNKFFEFLIDRLKLEDITESSLDTLDVSEIFSTYLQEINMEFSTYIDKYLKLLHTESTLESVFPPYLIKSIRG